MTPARLDLDIGGFLTNAMVDLDDGVPRRELDMVETKLCTK